MMLCCRTRDGKGASCNTEVGHLVLLICSVAINSGVIGSSFIVILSCPLVLLVTLPLEALRASYKSFPEASETFIYVL